jgi:undecaprenyl-diphosphatase
VATAGRSRTPSLHRQPPLTPAGVLVRVRWAAPVVAVALTLIALLAAVADDAVLRTVDEPVSRALMDVRSGPLDGVVKTVSALGGTTVVVAVLVLLLLLVWHECRALALTLLAASAARPALEWVLKEIVDRARPDIGRLVSGTGPSFPSGHVMAAIAIWGLLPPVVALLTGRRAAWWWSVGVSAAVIVSVAFTRVYLGVHWLSDVVGALLLGALYLVGVERLLDWQHRRRPCRAQLAEDSLGPVRAEGDTTTGEPGEWIT